MCSPKADNPETRPTALQGGDGPARPERPGPADVREAALEELPLPGRCDDVSVGIQHLDLAPDLAAGEPWSPGYRRISRHRPPCRRSRAVVASATSIPVAGQETPSGGPGEKSDVGTTRHEATAGQQRRAQQHRRQRISHPLEPVAAAVGLLHSWCRSYREVRRPVHAAGPSTTSLPQVPSSVAGSATASRGTSVRSCVPYLTRPNALRGATSACSWHSVSHGPVDALLTETPPSAVPAPDAITDREAVSCAAGGVVDGFLPPCAWSPSGRRRAGEECTPKWIRASANQISAASSPANDATWASSPTTVQRRDGGISVP